MLRVPESVQPAGGRDSHVCPGVKAAPGIMEAGGVQRGEGTPHHLCSSRVGPGHGGRSRSDSTSILQTLLMRCVDRQLWREASRLGGVELS